MAARFIVKFFAFRFIVSFWQECSRCSQWNSYFDANVKTCQGLGVIRNGLNWQAWIKEYYKCQRLKKSDIQVFILRFYLPSLMLRFCHDTELAFYKTYPNGANREACRFLNEKKSRRQSVPRWNRFSILNSWLQSLNDNVLKGFA